MGHDVHFLERLERVDVGQAERALGLYRNPKLVTALLAELPLPPNADRIAIALDATEPSAHVIVSRDGHFVTCLAAEMTLGSAFRVTRPQLDAVRARHERLRTALDTAGDGQLKRAFAHLSQDPENFSREEARIVAAVHPLLGPRLAVLSADYYTTHQNLIVRLNTREAPQFRRQGLKLLWKLQWALSVLMPAAMSQGVPPVLLKTEEVARKCFQSWFGQVAFGQLLGPTGARGLWSLTALARQTLPELKRLRTQALSAHYIAIANLTLGMVALRHPKYRAEIAKVLQTAPCQSHPDPERRLAVARVDRTTAEPVLKMLADPEKAQAESDAFLQAWRADTFPDLTDDPGTLFFVTYSEERHLVPVWPYECVNALPWLAKASFEDLFAPRAIFDSEPPTAEALEFLAEVGETVEVGRRPPVHAAPQVGRNEPCACGSGKKAKKCCAA